MHIPNPLGTLPQNSFNEIFFSKLTIPYPPILEKLLVKRNEKPNSLRLKKMQKLKKTKNNKEKKNPQKKQTNKKTHNLRNGNCMLKSKFPYTTRMCSGFSYAAVACLPTSVIIGFSSSIRLLTARGRNSVLSSVKCQMSW